MIGVCMSRSSPLPVTQLNVLNQCLSLLVVSPHGRTVAGRAPRVKATARKSYMELPDACKWAPIPGLAPEGSPMSIMSALVFSLWYNSILYITPQCQLKQVDCYRWNKYLVEDQKKTHYEIYPEYIFYIYMKYINSHISFLNVSAVMYIKWHTIRWCNPLLYQQINLLILI